jgi:hypothetical protein
MNPPQVASFMNFLQSCCAAHLPAAARAFVIIGISQAGMTILFKLIFYFVYKYYVKDI